MFGNIPECGQLTYFTNFTCKLGWGWGLALIARDGPVRIIAGAGGRMIPAAKLLTWVEDVRGARSAGEGIQAWAAELSGGDKRNRPVIGHCGFDLTPNAVYQSLAADTGDNVTLADGEAEIRALTTRKSTHECDIIRRSCGVLSQTAAAFRAAKNDRQTVLDGVFAAESACRAAGAQDIRSLFSLDEGRTLVPYQEFTDLRCDNWLTYMAVKLRGYWVDGLITAAPAGNTAAANAQAALQAMIDAAKPGVDGKSLSQATKSHVAGSTPHPFTGMRCGNEIGLSLDEPPFLEEGSDATLDDGGVYSLRIGRVENDGSCGLASAVVYVTPSGAQTLWSTA